MKFLLPIVLLAWLSVTISGTVYLARYENTPAESKASYPAVFPAKSRIKPQKDNPTLIFFAHPKCPCTRASLNELNRLMTDLRGKLQIYFVFMKPSGADENWAKTDLVKTAGLIPNSQIIIDENETETGIFNARTSGLILLYDAPGNLRYEGGITSSRGHEGESAGRRAIYRIVTQNSNSTAEAPVFGCPLSSKDSQTEETKYAQ